MEGTSGRDAARRDQPRYDQRVHRQRKASGVSARTINLEITVFRNVMRRALFDDKWITRLLTDNLRPLKSKPRKRPLVTPSEMEKICWAAFQPAFSEGKES